MAYTVNTLRERLRAQLQVLEDELARGKAAAPAAEAVAYEDVIRELRAAYNRIFQSDYRPALPAIAPVALLTSASRTADTDTVARANPNKAKGLILIVDITAGTGTIDALILKDSLGNVVATATPDSAIGGAAGRHVFVFYPGEIDFTTELRFAAGAEAFLPDSYIVTVDHTDATAVTYTLDAFEIR